MCNSQNSYQIFSKTITMSVIALLVLTLVSYFLDAAFMSLEFSHECLVLLQLTYFVIKACDLSLEFVSIQVACLLINPHVGILNISDKLGIKKCILQLELSGPVNKRSSVTFRITIRTFLESLTISRYGNVECLEKL